jgi:hypothetical protein
MNHRIERNHPNIWKLIKFMQAEEKRIQTIVVRWAADASNKKITCMTSIESRINTHYERYNNDLINASNLLTGLSYPVRVKRK